LRAVNIGVKFTLRGSLFEAKRAFTAVAGVSLCLVKAARSACRRVGLRQIDARPRALKLVPASGRISFDGAIWQDWNRAAMRPLRRSMQCVSRSPMARYRPCMRVSDIVTRDCACMIQPSAASSARRARPWPWRSPPRSRAQASLSAGIVRGQRQTRGDRAGDDPKTASRSCSTEPTSASTDRADRHSRSVEICRTRRVGLFLIQSRLAVSARRPMRSR